MTKYCLFDGILTQYCLFGLVWFGVYALTSTTCMQSPTL
jgi:hypothetical protein